MSVLSTVQQVGSTAPRGRSDSLASLLSTGDRAEPRREAPAGVAGVASGIAEVSRRMLERDRELSEAVRTRTADRAMKAKSDALERMQDSLQEVRKSYPPFPRGSEDRVRRLRQYAAFRALIDRLTVPPDESAHPKPQSPAERTETVHTFAVAGDGVVRTVRRDDAGSDAGLVPPPGLADESTDAEIGSAYESVVEARRKLDAGREALRQEALAFVRVEGTAPTTEAEAVTTASWTSAALSSSSLPVTTGSRTWMFQFLA